MGYIYFFLRVSASETIMTLFFFNKNYHVQQIIGKAFFNNYLVFHLANNFRDSSSEIVSFSAGSSISPESSCN